MRSTGPAAGRPLRKLVIQRQSAAPAPCWWFLVIKRNPTYIIVLCSPLRAPPLRSSSTVVVVHCAPT